LQVFQAASPPKVGPLGEHAQPATGRIQQHAVKAAVIRAVSREVPEVGLSSREDGRPASATPPLDSALQRLQASPVCVHRKYAPLMDMRRLTP
jgi:hypothetical protein